MVVVYVVGELLYHHKQLWPFFPTIFYLWLVYSLAIATVTSAALHTSISHSDAEGTQESKEFNQSSFLSGTYLVPLSRWDQVVLVTGAAGFIGYHVSRTLAEEWGANVVGLDSFTEYYDLQLKRDRVKELIKTGVHFYRGDVCDQKLLEFLFDKFKFTSVIHLAAQAGVRKSLKEPVYYVKNNVRCYLVLLEVIKDHKHISFVYASSSTVYGHQSPLPFSLSSAYHTPSNIYAATKISNEDFAMAFCSQYGLMAVGLRFFTVYGPWGRPDMAVYKFSRNMVDGRPVIVYESSEPVGRDLTYISDVVNGVLGALEHSPVCCGELYNIGSGKTVNLLDIVRILEEKLNVSANLEYQPLPLSDLPSTLANISMSTEMLGYYPKVRVEEGIRLFVRWFRKYHFPRSIGEEEKSNQQLESALVLGEREVTDWKKREIEKANTKYQLRIKALRNKYEELTKNELPSDTVKRFLYYKGVDSPGSNIIKAHGYHGNLELLKARCRLTEQCVAFNTLGEFKNHLKPQSEWTKQSDSEGLYVADIDPCASDLHNCGKHQDCIPTGPASHSCACHVGFVHLGPNCVEKYVEGVVSEAERKIQLADYFDGFDWEGTVQGKKFIFFQGLDSPGGDYLVDEGGAGDVKRLEKICGNTHHCLAFNSNGILKHSLHRPQKWTNWTRDSDSGLYVLDVDYCSLDQERCPEHSFCNRFSPGNYSCKCASPWVMSSQYTCMKGEEKVGEEGARKKEEGDVRKESMETIHIIISSDRTHLPGVVVLLNSLLNNTYSNDIKLHIVLTGLKNKEFFQYLQCYPSLPHLASLDIVQLDQRLLDGLIHVYNSPEGLDSPANFGRFFFHQLFPDLERAIYLDADTVVRGDIAEVWRDLCQSEELLLAAPRRIPYNTFFSSKVKQLFKKRYGKTLHGEDPTFNAGVYGVNLALWRKKNIHKEVLYWLDQQARKRLWRLGTQPVILLVAYNQWAKIDPLWNVNGLGWKNISKRILAEAKLLHWNGKDKPWLDGGLYRDLWLSHAPVACSGHGTCMNNAGTGYACRCEQDYSGDQCQISKT